MSTCSRKNSDNSAAVKRMAEYADAYWFPKNLREQMEFWSKEVLKHPGLDRLNLSRPGMERQGVISKGTLRPTKTGGRLVFKQAELDGVLEKGRRGQGMGKTKERFEMTRHSAAFYSQ